MATMSEIAAVAREIEAAIAAGAVEWGDAAAARARAATGEIGMAWDFTSWADALAALRRARPGARVLSVVVEE